MADMYTIVHLGLNSQGLFYYYDLSQPCGAQGYGVDVR